MLNKLIAVAAAFAVIGSLEVVSADDIRYSALSWKLVARVPQHHYGDPCHPIGYGTYRIPSNKLQAPCMMQQLIGFACEELTGAPKKGDTASWKAYWACHSNGSFFSEVDGCFDCKYAHNMISLEKLIWFKETVKKAKEKGQKAQFGSFWDNFQSVANWSQSGPDIPRSQWNTKGISVEQYYKKPPVAHSIGQFSAANTTKRKRELGWEGVLENKMMEKDGVKLEVIEKNGHLIGVASVK
ncbi:hypothetical protein XA68_16721 [Ophiocordyceps unilateralis]|uniref:Uncharacterized protein n=1 Tax=Ophiocordyceps unilateralis TaxID=268505 RepID=A0A2A9P4Q9_OPHUN|nr:hypothetical protein XA68_16721 [Ophiocordyceps unilateralis]